MPLVLIALDDTLLDRSGAFRLWAKGFLDEIGAPQDDLDWLLSVDADGLTPRWDLADLIRERYALGIPSIDVVDELHEGPLAYEKLDPLVGCALKIATDAGFVPVVVTNGQGEIQEARIRRTGLDRYVADWVISEQAGVSKPNPRIFALAAQRVRMRLGGAWVLGDSPEADIGGAAAMALPSVWLHRGRKWMDDRFAPTRVAGNVIQGLSEIMATAR
ncbi:HAD family hydrolase [Paractinoplanes atraurantiacus]|uniref:Putative hydrolase of the HAD superfamily n=1 Tax=Paractinoplanes atraurantiacus TaxID=1036182 RepID=A0A285IRC4_9ACTN|nr:HAD family hydrolase [Actinoplanes atraurantiacus]SNY50559.1 putative hydrolase of the HAD superfamily [Actinoplanes atraurantiacus]